MGSSKLIAGAVVIVFHFLMKMGQVGTAGVPSAGYKAHIGIGSLITSFIL